MAADRPVRVIDRDLVATLLHGAEVAARAAPTELPETNSKKTFPARQVLLYDVAWIWLHVQIVAQFYHHTDSSSCRHMDVTKAGIMARTHMRVSASMVCVSYSNTPDAHGTFIDYYVCGLKLFACSAR